MPFEVLSRVFEHLEHTHPYFERLADGRNIWNESSHLILRLVCRVWHKTVDNTTILWPSLIFGFGPEMTALALRLSREEPLDFILPLNAPWTDSHSLVLDHPRRIRTVEVSTTSWDTVERLTMLLRGSAVPKMTAFKLRPSLNFGGDRVILISEDILGATPTVMLNTLQFCDCTILLPSPLFTHSLVTLMLSRCDIWPDLNALVNTLSPCLSLEHFEWHMGQDTLMDSDIRLEKANFLTSTREPVILPRMKCLDVECPIACAAALMHFLVISPACQVTLADDYTLTGVRQEDLNALEELLSSLTASLGDHLGRVFPESHVGYDIISVSEDPNADDQKGALLIECRRTDGLFPSCSITLCVAREHDGRLDSEVLSSILRNIFRWPSMGVTATRFETNHEIFSSAVLWKTVLGNLPHIRMLYLDNSADSEASASVLGLSQTLSDSLDLATVLTHIELQNLSFPPLYQRGLAEAARHRRARGFPAIKLYAENCTEIGLEAHWENLMQAASDGALHFNILYDSSMRRYVGPRDLLNEDD